MAGLKVVNRERQQNLLYKLIKDSDYFATSRVIDFKTSLETLSNKYSDGYLLFEYPISKYTDEFTIFIQSLSMKTGFDWKWLYNYQSPDHARTLDSTYPDGFFYKDGTKTALSKDAIDLQTFIRVHDMGYITLSSDNSAYIINWTSAFSSSPGDNEFRIRKWMEEIGLGFTSRIVGQTERVERDQIKIDTTFWLNIVVDSESSVYQLYGDTSNYLLIGKVWLENGRGYDGQYFAEWDVLKFGLRKTGPFLKVKMIHGATGQQIYYPCYNNTILELTLEGQLKRETDTT